MLLFFNCTHRYTNPDVSQVKSDSVRQIFILYTNDEHGWMEPTENTGGAAGLMGLWKLNEGYSEEGPYLILSGGDNWSGPAISTWFQGVSMVDVMNGMGYDAAAIGNHEFDYKIENLRKNISRTNFPYLSANIRHKETGEWADFATPYVILEVNDIHVGITGLTTTTTPYSTFPDNVADYDFIPYESALQEVIPRMKHDGAELLIVLGHICGFEMRKLAAVASNLGVILLTGGHCHEKVNDRIHNVTIIEAGSYLRHYAKVKILFDIEADTLVMIESAIVDNSVSELDPNVEDIVYHWKTKTDAELSQPIGYVNDEIGRHSSAMHNMITDSWLISFPESDVSLTNRGGIRQSIPKGEISLATMVGVLPFENSILELNLTGTQLIDCIDNLVMGGMTMVGGHRLSNGSPIHPDSIYTVLTIDYLYARSTTHFRDYDPEPYDTSVHYRQPVIDWIKSLNTSKENPLDKYLDPVRRN